jgi:hypothetical protein
MIWKSWSVSYLKNDQTSPPSKQAFSSTSLTGKAIFYKREKYIVDPEALCIRPKDDGVLPIRKIVQAVMKGTIRAIDDT